MAEKYVSGEDHRRMVESGKIKKARPPIDTRLMVGALVVVAIIGFVVGMEYQKSHDKSASQSVSTGRFGGFGGGGQRGLRVIGTVSSISSTSITVDSRYNNAPSTFSINSSTQITDSGQTVSYTDIQVGETVFITKSSTSSTVAVSIDVNPTFGGGYGGASGAPPSSSNSSSSLSE